MDLAFDEGGNMVRTQPASLVKDFDTLPIPAYDLMPMHLYGKSRYLFSPGVLHFTTLVDVHRSAASVHGGPPWLIAK